MKSDARAGLARVPLLGMIAGQEVIAVGQEVIAVGQAGWRERFAREKHHCALEDFSLCATHRVMNGAMDRRLKSPLKDRVTVDTPECWQGLERKLLVMVHPLSGDVTPSDFDLETGRLCVMASRHQAGVTVLTRDHLSQTLDEYLPRAEQPVALPDVAGRGHDRNLKFWRALEATGRVGGN